MPKYLLDTNVFVTSLRYMYHKSFCPGYIDALSLLARKDIWGSIRKCGEELKDVESAEWYKHNKRLFVEYDVVDELKRIYSAIGSSSGYYFAEHQVDFFEKSADCYLIASAMHVHGSVVTLESRSQLGNFKKPGNNGRIKIPDVCDLLGVNVLNLTDFLKENSKYFQLVCEEKRCDISHT